MTTPRKSKRNQAFSIEQIVPEAEGYLIVDPKKCTGCGSCMLACSLAHEGNVNPAFSRIQIISDPLGYFPVDIQMAVCKQCLYPQCLIVCPTDALHIDTEHMNVRSIDREKCIGCQKCMQACPFVPSRICLDVHHKKAFKCDLCKAPPYRKKKSGLACVEICPVNAIKFSAKTPSPLGETGYTKNLRGDGWEQLGLPTD